MVTALYSKRNRLSLHTLVFVLLVSWISLAISTTCTMPLGLIKTSDQMPGCSESGVPEHSHHQDHAPESMQDCSFKPCLDSQADSFTDFNRLTKPELPVFILSFIWTFWCLFLNYAITKVAHKVGPPSGRRILLIYRFRTLLN